MKTKPKPGEEDALTTQKFTRPLEVLDSDILDVTEPDPSDLPTEKHHRSLRAAQACR